MVADRRQALEFGEREPGDGRIIAVLGQAQADPFGQQVRRPPARNEEAAVLALEQRGIVAFVLIRHEVAGNR